MEKFEAIDVTRAVAVALVVWVHAHHIVPGLNVFVAALFGFGHLGVQLFFLASAFTLCHSMASRGEVDLKKFYLRRFFRIAPLYYAAIVFYFVWRNGLEQFLGVEITGDYSPTAFLLNFLFLHGFSPEHYNYVVPGGWSIATEMAFYAIFPFIFALVIRMKPGMILLAALSLAAATASGQWILYNIVNSVAGTTLDNDEFNVFYASIFNQMPIFILGICVYFARKRALPRLAPVVAIALILAGNLIQNDRAFDTGVDGAIYPFLVSCGFAIFLLLGFQRLNRKPLAEGSRFAAFVLEAGRRSYSIYICHFAVLHVLRELYARLGVGLDPNLAPFAIFIVMFLTTYVIAGFTMRYIEQPGIELGKAVIARLDRRRLARAAE
ncbi:MAG: acyltransferase family protein [Pikeienuella sp.]|uniref:acyltransferase family protein n=1 Tax=Pikeienuella sp. TaxID=2831957 RepID=UPI00391C6859